MDGIVIKLNEKGFGFISVKDARVDARDLFFHSNELIDVFFEELREGDSVSYDVHDGPKRPFAVNVGRNGGRRPQEARERLVDQVMFALTVVDEQVRVLGVTRDGTCQFVDPNINVHSLLYVSETVALRHAIEEFESLLNQDNVSEAIFQDFFERHPEFILDEEHRAAHPHMALESELRKDRLIPDFVLEPLKPGALSDILEVKLPSAPLYVQKINRARFSAVVNEACAQLREYSAFFDREENREKLRCATAFSCIVRVCSSSLGGLHKSAPFSSDEFKAISVYHCIYEPLTT